MKFYISYRLVIRNLSYSAYFPILVFGPVLAGKLVQLSLWCQRFCGIKTQPKKQTVGSLGGHFWWPCLRNFQAQTYNLNFRELIEEHHGLDLHSLEEHPISSLFIIMIAAVILVFHALLFHMVYKEFCSGDRGHNKDARWHN